MKESRTGLTKYATTVAFTTARSLTSHLRAWFHARYKPRYRYAPLVFGFDLFLLGVAGVLLVFNLFLLVGFFRPTNGGIALDFRTPQLIRGSDATPIEAHLRATDGRAHENVALRWKLPDWVEILSASPPLVNGAVQLGELRPGEEKVARLLVRIRAPGGYVPFGFEISQRGFFGIPSVVSGEKQRIVNSSALVMVGTEVGLPGSVNPDASIPIIVANNGSAYIKLVSIRLTEKKGAPEAKIGSGDVFFLKDLAPEERRVVFLDVGHVNLGDRIQLAWELSDGPQLIDSASANLDVVDTPIVHVTQMRSRRGVAEAEIFYENAKALNDYLLVTHPALLSGEPDEDVTLQQKSGRAVVKLDSSRAVSSTEWSVSVYRELTDPEVEGPIGVIYGPRTVGHISATFPFTADARYYSAIGDQLGIGPLPPKVGEITSYWIVWSVGPLESELKTLAMNATLPANVRATGKFASQNGGTFSTDGKTVNWTVPSVLATGSATTFAFEVELTPTKDQIGKAAKLISESSATAADAKSGETLDASADAADTTLAHDAKAKGRGVVR